MAVVLFFAYTIFLLLMVVNHVRQYRKWQTKNMILFVVDQLDAEQSLHYNPQWKKRHSLKAKLSESWVSGEVGNDSILYILREDFVDSRQDP